MRCIILLGLRPTTAPGACRKGRKQVDDYLTKAYTGFHGDTSGLAELKAQAKSAALPPAGFKIKSVREIALEKAQQEEEFNKNNPQLAAWKAMKQGLTGDHELLGADEGREAGRSCADGRFSQRRRKSSWRSPIQPPPK